jgi:hypothetical protein
VLKGIGEPKRAAILSVPDFFALLAAARQHQCAPRDALIADPV